MAAGALTARDYSRALTERLPAHERVWMPRNLLDLSDATVCDRSLVIMASYEREPETQAKPQAHKFLFDECSRFHGVATALSTRGAPTCARRFEQQEVQVQER